MNMKFKDNLRKQRNLANLSQETLADKMSVSRQTISKWENGDTYPSTEHIIALAEILKCNVNDLISDNTNKNATSNNDKSASSTYQLNQKSQHATKPQTHKYLYWMAGIITAIFLMLCGFGISKLTTTSPLSSSKLEVFDQILNGSLENAMGTFTKDGYSDPQIIGYGITENDKIFYVKCNLNNDQGNPCSAIIYFCENDGDYVYECQYLDDPDFIPKGEYIELGVI